MRKLNKKISSLVLFCVGAIFAQACFADLYLGLDAKHQRQKLGDYKFDQATLIFDKSKVKNGALGLNFGYSFNEYFALESGYDIFSVKSSDLTNTRIPSSYRNNGNVYVDALGYLPINEDFKLEGSFGLGALHSKASYHIVGGVQNESANRWTTGLRAGIGAVYKLSDNWDAKFRVRYQDSKASKSGVKNMMQTGLGIAYNF